MARKPIFMVHMHHATHLHFDVRLEMEGKLKSWALRDITMKPHKSLLAIQVPDHPFWYRHFEGVIPPGNYGAGPVMIWDKGLYSSFARDHNGKAITLIDSYKQGCMMLWIEGHKLKGGFIFIRISKKQRWFMVKLDDQYAKMSGRMPKDWMRSVKSGYTMEQIVKEDIKKLERKRIRELKKNR